MIQQEIKVVGKGGISAKILADSVNPAGKRLTSFEIEVHRLVWSEFLTHRVFSRNGASSRAIPTQKVIDMVRENPATPIHFGINQPGMQAREELQGEDLEQAKRIWWLAAQDAANRAQQMAHLKVHKQVINRILEPFVMMKAVVTATELDNFFKLRLHSDADPHIYELARVMDQAMKMSTPAQLTAGQWHVPYVTFKDGQYWVDADTPVDLDTAIKVSVSCCAQVSYRKLDTSIQKALDIYNRLIESKPEHASPCEHQAMVPTEIRNLTTPCRNFVGWVQYRSILNI